MTRWSGELRLSLRIESWRSRERELGVERTEAYRLSMTVPWICVIGSIPYSVIALIRLIGTGCKGDDAPAEGHFTQSPSN